MSASTLLAPDVEIFRHLKIPRELLERAGVERVDSREWREKYDVSANGGGDYAGIAYPYYSSHDGHRVGARLRRDNPPLEGGKQAHKYHWPYRDRRHLYFVRGVNYGDPDALIVLVEAEKSALALTALAERTGTKFAPIATGGLCAVLASG